MNPDDKDFVDLVAQYVRGNLSRDKEEALLHDDTIDELYTGLVTLKRNVEVQLSNHHARAVKKQHELNVLGDDGTMWKAYQAEEADWRARAIKFLSAVEEHISQTKARRRDLHQLAPKTDPERLLAQIKEGILEHQEEISLDEASDADKRLWELVESI